MSAPVIASGSGKFTIAFSHRSIYNQAQTAWINMFAEYDFDSNQKKILIAGMNGRELSPSDIYSSLGSLDRNLYDKCVTALRIKGILQEIRSNPMATTYARKNNIDKRDVKRFRISLPTEINASDDMNLYTSKVYVYNIPQTCNEEKLKAAMKIFGEIMEVFIPHV